MDESNGSGPTRITFLGAISQHTERDPGCQKTFKGIQLLLDYWWRIHQRRRHEPPESVIKDY